MYRDRSDDIYPPIHKFGPVNVTVLGERHGYCGGGGGGGGGGGRGGGTGDEDSLSDGIITNKTAGSAALACVYLMVGANIMLTYIYSIHWHLSFINNLHIFLCASGFQLLIPMGILMQCRVNGPSQLLTQEERTKQHMVLQISGSVMGIIGAICVVVMGGTTEDNKWSLHCLVGIVTCGFALLSMFTGLAFKLHGEVSPKHPVYGVSAYFMSSVCFVLGTVKNDFVIFVPMSLAPDVVYMVIIFCAISTLIVIYFPIRTILAKR